jgi:hypothetical protein
VQLDPQQFDRFQQLAGNELKNPATHMGAKDTLNSLVTGTNPSRNDQQSWDAVSPAMKAVWVQRIVNGFRNAAKIQLRQEFPEIEATIQDGAQNRMQQLRGQQ